MGVAKSPPQRYTLELPMPPGLILIHQVPAESEMPASEQEPESASAHLAGLAALWNLCFHWSWKKEIFIIWKHSSGPRANRLWGAGSSAQQLRDTAWGWPGRALGSSGQLKTLFLFWFWFFFSSWKGSSWRKLSRCEIPAGNHFRCWICAPSVAQDRGEQSCLCLHSSQTMREFWLLSLEPNTSHPPQKNPGTQRKWTLP